MGRSYSSRTMLPGVVRQVFPLPSTKEVVSGFDRRVRMAHMEGLQDFRRMFRWAVRAGVATSRDAAARIGFR